MMSLLTTASLSKSKLSATSGSSVLMEQLVITPPSSKLVLNERINLSFYSAQFAN